MDLKTARGVGMIMRRTRMTDDRIVRAEITCQKEEDSRRAGPTHSLFYFEEHAISLTERKERKRNVLKVEDH
jgi:hypothetical protein